MRYNRILILVISIAPSVKIRVSVLMKRMCLAIRMRGGTVLEVKAMKNNILGERDRSLRRYGAGFTKHKVAFLLQ